MTRTSATISRQTTGHGRRTAAARSAGACEAPALVPNPAAAAGPVLAACPTCLSATEPSLDALPDAAHPGVRAAQCPTCGVSSIEYGLVLAIDAVLADMGGLERLDRAL